MEPITVFLAAGLIGIAVLILLRADKKKSEVASRVNKLRGPTNYPILGTAPPLIFLKRNEIFKYVLTISRVFSPIFRTWTGRIPQVHLQRPEDIEVILRSSEHLDKAHFYRFLHQWLGTGLLTSTGQKWHTHRKMITPTFHFKILDNFVEVFSEKSEILVRKLQKEVGSQGFDVYPYITKCALDIICETAMGTPIYAQDDRGSDYVKAVYDMSEIIMHRMLRPWLHPDFIFKFTTLGKRTDQCLRVLHGFTNRVIQERKASLQDSTRGQTFAPSGEDISIAKKRKAFLDLLLEASVDGVKLTDEELREEVDTFMFEGHDTTSAGLSWALFLLGLHPHIQDRAYQEQKSIFQGSDRPATMKDLNEMKYLERVIKESLRLYPSVPGIARTLKKDVKIAGYDIPSECTILVQIYVLHRNPDQFPDPEKFDPDNFLPERASKRHPYAYIPFSAGPRNCIGQKFALLEEKTVLSYILRHYKLRSLDKREDVALLSELVLRPENGVRLGLSLRNVGMK
ncbi:Cytochrome P450 4C1 [Zootermopsis nevadensis]|nr:Cytochrome P450 4C1 [Zootermopsis nevadensis]